ncbi:hypothetical protein K9M42_01625 [Patescibacteria group bacterium]|nr:hypothetical protein [Patescibacteria group bacterium]
MNSKFLNIFIIITLSIISGIFGSIIILSSDFSKSLVFSDDSFYSSVVIEKTEEYNINENVALKDNILNTKEYMVYIANKNADDLYKKDSIETSGFFVTNSGWAVVSSEFISTLKVKEGFSFNDYIFDNYVVIDNDSNIYSITDSIITNYGITFIKIEKNVKNIIDIASDSDLYIGSKVFSFDKYGEFDTSYIKNKKGDILKFSSILNSDEKLLWFFDLSNKLVGFYNLDNFVSAENLRYFLNKIKDDIDNITFNNIKIKYINLNSDLYGYNKENYNLGFLVEEVLDEDLPFEKFDIITEINNYKVYNSLEFMLKSLNNDSYEFKVLRGGEELILEVKN